MSINPRAEVTAANDQFRAAAVEVLELRVALAAYAARRAVVEAMGWSRDIRAFMPGYAEHGYLSLAPDLWVNDVAEVVDDLRETTDELTSLMQRSARDILGKRLADEGDLEPVFAERLEVAMHDQAQAKRRLRDALLVEVSETVLGITPFASRVIAVRADADSGIEVARIFDAQGDVLLDWTTTDDPIVVGDNSRFLPSGSAVELNEISPLTGSSVLQAVQFEVADTRVAIECDNERARAPMGSPADRREEVSPRPRGLPLLSVGELRLALQRVGVTIDPVAASATSPVVGESVYLWVMPGNCSVAPDPTTGAGGPTRPALDGRIVLYIGSAKTASRTANETYFQTRERLGGANLFGRVTDEGFERLEMLSGITALLSPGAELIRVYLGEEGSIPLDRKVLKKTIAAIAERLTADSMNSKATANDLRVGFFRPSIEQLPAEAVDRQATVQRWLRDLPSGDEFWNAQSADLEMLDLERLMIRIAVRQGKLIGNSADAGQWEGPIYTKLDMLAVLAAEGSALSDR